MSDLCALCGKHVGTSLVFDGESRQLGGVLGFLSVMKKAVLAISQGISKEVKVEKDIKVYRDLRRVLHHECASIPCKTGANALILGSIDPTSQIMKTRRHNRRILHLQTTFETHLRDWNTCCIFLTAKILFLICCLLTACSEGG